MSSLASHPLENANLAGLNIFGEKRFYPLQNETESINVSSVIDWAVGDIGNGLHGTLLETGAGARTSTDRSREPKPLFTIVIAVLEQMLGCRDPEPSAQPRRRKPHAGSNDRKDQKPDLDDAPKIFAQHNERTREEH